MPHDKGIRHRLKKIRDTLHSEHKAGDHERHSLGATGSTPGCLATSPANGSLLSVAVPTRASSVSTAASSQASLSTGPGVDLGGQAFQLAVSKFQDGLKEEERRVFQAAIGGRDRKGIVEEIIQLDRQHEKSSTSRQHAPQIHSIIRILDPSIQMLSLGLSADPTISTAASLILGGFKVVLQVR